jgi:hypothetical protein
MSVCPAKPEVFGARPGTDSPQSRSPSAFAPRLCPSAGDARFSETHNPTFDAHNIVTVGWTYEANMKVERRQSIEKAQRFD